MGARRTRCAEEAARGGIYGRSTFSFVLAAELQRVDDAAELRKTAQAVSILAVGAAGHDVQNYGRGRQRAGGGGDSLPTARSGGRCVGGGEGFSKCGRQLSPGDVVGLMAIRR